MAANWYIRINHEKVAGPYSAKQLKRAADSGQIHRRTVVKKGELGEWVTADRVNGLLSLDAANPIVASNEVAEETIEAWLGEGEVAPAPPPPEKAPEPIAVPITPRPVPPTALKKRDEELHSTGFMQCPYCLEEIKVGATKCRFCHEFLDSNDSLKQLTESVPDKMLDTWTDMEKSALSILVAPSNSEATQAPVKATPAETKRTDEIHTLIGCLFVVAILGFIAIVISLVNR